MNVLFLTHRLPYAPNRGDRNRAFHLLKAMSGYADVSLFSLVHDDEEAGHAGEVPFAHDVTIARVPRVRNLLRGAVSLAGSRPLTHSLLDAPSVRPSLSAIAHRHPPDVVMAFCSGMARFALEPPLRGLPLVIDMVDVDSEKWLQVAARTRGPQRFIYSREARTLRRFEAIATSAAFETLVVNERERLTLSRIAPGARISVIQNGIDIESFRPTTPPVAKSVVVFCGVMNYYPNEEGVQWFATQVWPMIRRSMPGASFVVVGSSPTRQIQRLASADPSITVVGTVPAVQPYLHAAAVAVAPLRLARGIQTKVIEGLAAGLPVVVTPEVAAGLPAEAEPGYIAAGSPEEFANAVVGLLRRSPDERRALANSAPLAGLAWAEQTRPLETILSGAVTETRQARDSRPRP